MTPTPSTPLQQEAALLQSRLQSGEEVPLSLLQDFILQANQSLKTQRKQADKPDSAIDFF